MLDDPLYQKFLKLLNDTLYGEEVYLAWGEAEDVMKVLWPEIEKLYDERCDYDCDTCRS